MTPRSARWRSVALMGAVLVALGLASPAAVAADHGLGVTFGRPVAQGTLGDGLSFSVPVTTNHELDRVELLLRFPDTLGPHVVEVEPPAGTGALTLEHRWDETEHGHLVPNTTVEATWRVTVDDGPTTVVSEGARVTLADDRFAWRTLEGDVVRVHWYEGGDGFGRRALEIGEQAVRETSALLGVVEDRPIDFFVYADESSFRAALGPGTRENVGGQAHADIRTLFALITPDEIESSWVSSVIPHELVHLVFDTAVDNPYRFPPRWLNEGLATYLSQGYDASDRARVSDAAASGELIPLTGLTGNFPTTYDRFALAYAESTSAVDHLVRTYDRDALISLVRSYREGLTDDEAFERAVGQDVAGFQADWFAALGAVEPVRHGPVAAPAGPLPEGWTEDGDGSGSPAAPTAPTAPLPGPTAAPTPVPAADDGPGPAVLATAAVALLVIVGGGALLLLRRTGRQRGA